MPAHTSNRRLLFRFAAGALELGLDRLLRELRSVNHEPRTAVSAGHAYELVGAVVAARAWVRSAARTARAYHERTISPLVAPPLRFARRTGVGARVEHRIRRLRARANEALADWYELGRVELDSGRELAETTLDRAYAGVFARLAGPELATLVHEQSAGLTRDVVDDLRERSASADTRAEQLVRRLRRKH